MWTYIPVPINELPLNETYSFDLYLTYNKKFVLFRGKNLAMDEGVLNQLRDNGVEHIYIQKGDYPKYLRLLYKSEGYKGESDLMRYLHDHFIYIDSRSLKVGSIPSFTIFALESEIPTPIVAQDIPGLESSITDEMLRGRNSLYIHQKEMDSFSQYLEAIWAENASYTPMNAEGGILLRENAKSAAFALFTRDNPAEAMQQASESVHTIMDRMFVNPEVYYVLLKVSDQDFNTYIHSVNVSVLSMGLGIRMKMTPPEIHWLGLAGLLHDIGKRMIAPDLLLKKNKISPSEYERLQEHAILGQEFCAKQENLAPEVGQMVLQHHEKLDGSGYPLGLREEQLELRSQILALMEIYDSLTSRQPFRDAFTPFHALERIREMGKGVNQELLTQYIYLLGDQRKEP